MIIKGTKGEYKVERNSFLGRGAFGVVYVAIKRISKGKLPNSESTQYEYEEVVMKEFKKS